MLSEEEMRRSQFRQTFSPRRLGISVGGRPDRKKTWVHFLLNVFSVWEYMGSRHSIQVEVSGQLANLQMLDPVFYHVSPRIEL